MPLPLPLPLPLLVSAAVLVAASPRIAHAEDPPPLDAARDYFAGERAQGAAWTAVGAAAITAGVLAYRADSELSRGAAYPLLAVGVIQLGAGVLSYISPPRRLRRAEAAVAKDPEAYRVGELKRMKRVVFAFGALRVTYVTLMAVSAGLVIAGSRDGNDTMVGVGGGLGFQALAMLALDDAAETRAIRYVERLSIAVAPSTASVIYNMRW